MLVLETEQPVMLDLSATEADTIADLIEILIERLDMISGDCDLEDDDPAGGNVDDGSEAPTLDCDRYFYSQRDQRKLYDSDYPNCVIKLR